MRVHTSIRQRSFRPRRQGTHEPHDARKRGGTAKPLARARISWKLDHPGICTPLHEMLTLNPKSPSAIPSSKVSSSTVLNFCGAPIRLTAPVSESPLVNGAHVHSPHSILQNFLFERARRDRRVTSLILHALRPILDSPLVNSVSLLVSGTRWRRPGFSAGSESVLRPFMSASFPGLVGERW